MWTKKTKTSIDAKGEVSPWLCFREGLIEDQQQSPLPTPAGEDDKKKKKRESKAS